MMLAAINDHYSVSDAGVVIGKRGNPLKPMFRNGYARVEIFGKCIPIHRLVAKAFIPTREGFNEVNHIDGDKTNNHVSNLEWSNRSENLKHATRTGLITNMGKGEDGLRAILTQEQVDFVRKNCVKRDKELSMSALAKRFGVSVSCIHLAYHGKNWN